MIGYLNLLKPSFNFENPYKTDDYNVLLWGFQPETKMSGFRKSFTVNAGTGIEVLAYDFKKDSYALLPNNKFVGTDMVLVFTQNGEPADAYILILFGDVDGDGKIGTSDLLALKKEILGIKYLNGAYWLAAKVSGKSGYVGAADLLALKKHILGITSISQK